MKCRIYNIYKKSILDDIKSLYFIKYREKTFKRRELYERK